MQNMMCNLFGCAYDNDLDKLHELVNKGLGRGFADGEDFADVGNFGVTDGEDFFVGNFGVTCSILDQLKSVST